MSHLLDPRWIKNIVLVKVLICAGLLLGLNYTSDESTLWFVVLIVSGLSQSAGALWWVGVHPMHMYL